MTIRNLVYIFFTSLLVGIASALLAGTYLQLTDEQLSVADFSLIGFNALAGMTFSIVSQMGFFAYLTINYIARAMIKRQVIWFTVQWILIAIVFFDLIYLRTVSFTEANAGALAYTVLPVVLLLMATGVGIWKANLTNWTAFTPTIFFMFVATALEAIPALRENNADATLFMIVPLLACNAWQVLILHKMVKTKKVAPSPEAAQTDS